MHHSEEGMGPLSRYYGGARRHRVEIVDCASQQEGNGSHGEDIMEVHSTGIRWKVDGPTEKILLSCNRGGNCNLCITARIG